MIRVYNPADIAEQYAFVRETLGPNRGVFVESIQRISDNRPGESWCMSFVSMCLWIAYQRQPLLPRTGACAVAYAVAKQSGWITQTPVRGDVFFRLDVATDHAHHTGFVAKTYPNDPTRVSAIAGNTSADGLSSNGVGVFTHDLTKGPSLVFVHLPDDPPIQLAA